MIREDMEKFSKVRNPKPEDYQLLFDFTKSILRLFHRERKRASSMNKKRSNLANENKILKERLESLSK